MLFTQRVGQGLGREPMTHSSGATKGGFSGPFRSLGKSVKNVTYLVLPLAAVGSHCHPRPAQKQTQPEREGGEQLWPCVEGTATDPCPSISPAHLLLVRSGAIGQGVWVMQ